MALRSLNPQYERLLRGSGSSSEMPLDKFYQQENMFQKENPYASADSMPAVEDLSGPIQPGVVESGKTSQKDFQEARAQGTAGEAAGEAGADALIAFGDPTMKAAGLGLKTAFKINEIKRQNQIDNYNAEVRRIQARQDAINQMAQIGRGLKA